MGGLKKRLNREAQEILEAVFPEEVHQPQGYNLPPLLWLLDVSLTGEDGEVQNRNLEGLEADLWKQMIWESPEVLEEYLLKWARTEEIEFPSKEEQTPEELNDWAGSLVRCVLMEMPESELPFNPWPTHD